jgi:RNA polymerase sigma-70 factor (ECF subfamily)
MDQARIKPTDWARTPDPELLAQIAAGRMGAFEALMQRYNRKLYRAARGITGDDAEAEDVVQEAWTRAYSHLVDFRGEAQLSTWLVRIAVNEALARRRRGRPTIAIDQMDERQISNVIMFPAETLDQESDLSRTEVHAMLEQAVDSLPPAFRMVFVMRAIEELSVEQIAAQLDISQATVRTRMHRSRALLRKALETRFATCLADLFPFDGARCRAMTERVMAAIGATRTR